MRHLHAPAELVKGWRLCESGCSSAGAWRLPFHRPWVLCPSFGRIRSPSLAPVPERAGGCWWNKPSQTQGKSHGTVLRAGRAAQELGPPSSAALGGLGMAGGARGQGWTTGKTALLPSHRCSQEPPSPGTVGAHVQRLSRGYRDVPAARGSAVLLPARAPLAGRDWPLASFGLASPLLT